MSIKNNLDMTQEMHSTSIPSHSTQISSINLQLTTIAQTLETIQKTQMYSPSPSVQETTLSTKTPVVQTQIPNFGWYVTKMEGFNNDVKIENNNSTITINSNKVRSNRGYIYIPISNIAKIDFDMLLYKFPNLSVLENNMVDSSNNYQLMLGVGEKSIIENNANNNNYLQAKIYPTISYDPNQKISYWRCCGIIGESTFLDKSKITNEIPSFVISDLLPWEIKIENGQISISVDNIEISNDFNISQFVEPVFYIGYFQSSDCGDSCPINLQINDIKISYRQ